MERILSYINNYFAITKETGMFNISTNTIQVKGKYIEGQYMLIRGSVMNDGLYKIQTITDGLITIVGAINEVFEGVIYGLAIPKDILTIETELKTLENKYATGVYQSESFGNYSYSLATNRQGEKMTPFDAITPKLRPYRRMYETSLSKAKEV